jgi:hypothetical protein
MRSQGYLALLQWWWHLRPREQDMLFKKCFEAAASNGRVNVCAWLLECFPLETDGRGSLLASYDEAYFTLVDMCKPTALGGHVSVLQFILSHLSNPFQRRDVARESFASAARAGQLNVMEWLVDAGFHI